MGDIYGPYDPTPEKRDPLSRLRQHFGGESGVAKGGVTGPRSVVSQGDPMAGYAGPADVPLPESRRGMIEPGGGTLNLNRPMPTREVREEPVEQERQIQELLNRAGYGVEADGFFGPQSLTALNDFVSAHVSPNLSFSMGDEIPTEIIVALRNVGGMLR